MRRVWGLPAAGQKHKFVKNKKRSIGISNSRLRVCERERDASSTCLTLKPLGWCSTPFPMPRWKGRKSPLWGQKLQEAATKFVVALPHQPPNLLSCDVPCIFLETGVIHQIKNEKSSPKSKFWGRISGGHPRGYPGGRPGAKLRSSPRNPRKTGISGGRPWPRGGVQKKLQSENFGLNFRSPFPVFSKSKALRDILMPRAKNWLPIVSR